MASILLILLIFFAFACLLLVVVDCCVAFQLTTKHLFREDGSVFSTLFAPAESGKVKYSGNRILFVTHSEILYCCCRSKVAAEIVMVSSPAGSTMRVSVFCFSMVVDSWQSCLFCVAPSHNTHFIIYDARRLPTMWRWLVELRSVWAVLELETCSTWTLQQPFKGEGRAQRSLCCHLWWAKTKTSLLYSILFYSALLLSWEEWLEHKTNYTSTMNLNMYVYCFLLWFLCVRYV